MSLDFAATQRFLTGLWAMEDVGRPAFRLMGWNRQEYQPPPGLALDERYRDNFINQMRSALEVCTYPDDGMPLLNSYIHIGMHASAFGCQIVREPGQEPKVLPVVRSIDDFEKLGQPRHSEETRLGMQYIELLNSQRRPGWRVTHTDLQGPTDTASLVWDYTDMLASGYSDPQLVHELLDRVTRFIVQFECEQLKRVPDLNLNHNPSVWLPPGMGISASEDLLAVVSPQWYREFGLPYNNRLAEIFNGIVIHTCGKFTQNLPVLAEHKLMRGLNFNLGEVDIEPLLDALAGKTVLLPRLGLGGGGSGEALLRRYVDHLRKNRLDQVHHFYIIDGDGKRPLEDVLKLLKELGIAE
jgi:hypothetical protein